MFTFQRVQSTQSHPWTLSLGSRSMAHLHLQKMQKWSLFLPLCGSLSKKRFLSTNTLSWPFHMLSTVVKTHKFLLSTKLKRKGEGTSLREWSLLALELVWALERCRPSYQRGHIWFALLAKPLQSLFVKRTTASSKPYQSPLMNCHGRFSSVWHSSCLHALRWDIHWPQKPS